MVSTSKKAKSSIWTAPVEKRSHDWVKDDEELDLESKLFGASKKRRAGEGTLGGGRGEIGGDELDEVDDEDLFVVDAPLVTIDDSDEEDERSLDGGEESGADGEIAYDEDDSDGVSDDGSDSGESSASSSASSAPSIAFDDGQQQDHDDHDAEDRDDEEHQEGQNINSTEFDISFPSDLITPSAPDVKGKAKSVWTDPSDEVLLVDLATNRRLKKLARGKKGGGDSGKEVSGKELESRLREQFERLHPRPEWAEKRTQIGTPSISSLLSSTKSFIAGPSTSEKKRGALPQGRLEIQRMVNANHQNPTVGQRAAQGAGKGVVDVVWHPSARVGVMAVVGGDRRVRFFNIDGHTNPTLLTIHLPGLPLTNASFHPSGSSLLLTGIRPYYYTYDLASSKCIRSPRNLFGTTPSPSSPNSLGRHKFSPDGSMLAVAGRRGAVAILDWSGTGTGAVIAELKSGRGASVVAMEWSYDGKELSVLGGRDGAEVEVWDIASRRIVRKWNDDRAFGGSVMSKSHDGAYTAIGSSTGIVNLYSSSSLRETTEAAGQVPYAQPTPVKSLEHLTSGISTVAFHPSNELLMTASNTRSGRLKLYHLPSGTAYGNWPTNTTPLGRVNTASFSTSGEYLAAGNQRGNVVLYRLKHYMS